MSNVLKMLSRGGAAAAETDPNFNQTVLLLHGDGTNGAQNNTFLDSSTNNFTITRNGNTTQGTFSPFSVAAGEWSNYFDGTANSSLRADATTDTNLSGDFTLQAWIFPTANGQSSQSEIMSRGAATTLNGWHLYYLFNHNSSGANRIGFGVNYAGILGQSSTNLPLNQWSHIALTRSGNNFTFYLNGVADGTFTSSSTPTVSGTEYVYVGRASYDTTNRQFPGYISNASIIKGTVLTTFNTTTPLSTSATNQSLLTCTLNRFVDANTATTAKTLTVGSAVRVTPFSPFAPTAAYSAGTNGGSGYFDGTGDYLALPTSQQIVPATGDLTIEGWFYPTSLSADAFLYTQTNGGASAGRLNFYVGSTGTLNFQVGSSSYTGTSGVIRVGQWNHLAVTRTGTSVAFYANGATAGSGTVSGTIDTGSSITDINRSASATTSTVPAYYGSFRISDNVRSSLTTVPTAPFTSDGNTKLLCNFTNAGILDQTGKNNLETVGNAQIDTAVKKFGTGSLEFDGTGDYLIIPDSPELWFSNGNFTVELWANFSVATSGVAYVFVGQATDAFNVNAGFAFLRHSSNKLRFIFTDDGTGASGYKICDSTNNFLPTTGVWYHLAATRSGNTFKLFIDGVEVGSATLTASIFNSTRPITIGADSVGAVAFNGYIDDLRITKGVARYTANFTAPTKEFPDQ